MFLMVIDEALMGYYTMSDIAACFLWPAHAHADGAR